MPAACMIRRCGLLVVALAAWLAPVCQVGAAGAASTVEVYGVVTAQASDTVTVRTPNGSEVVVGLTADWRAFLGSVVGRTDVAPGTVVGVTAIVVGSPVERGTIARDYWVAGPGLSGEAGAQAMAIFVPPAAEARPRLPETRPVIGTFKELRSGTIMIVETGQGAFWIKLGPEATGTQVEPGERRAIVSGARVLINMAPDHRSSGVLVIEDGSSPFGRVDGRSR